MLQVIRDRAQGVFAWIIVGMISIPFALWGINSYFGGGGDDSVAEVDDVKISARQLQSSYQQQRERLAQMFGGKIPENLFSEETMKKQVLQQLIEKELLIKAAVDNGMRIGDQQLGELVTGIQAFQTDGAFDMQQYERVLAQQGMSPKLFENRVRRDLIASQFTDAIASSEFVLDSEIDAQLKLQQQQRDIGYMVLPFAQYQQEIAIDVAELRNYYETNSARFMQPEQVKIDYLELKSEDIAAAFEIGEDELRQRYETHKLNFRTPEERKASHILVTIPVAADEAQTSEARAKAESLLQRLQGGEDFAELAKAESQDPGSARNGGDLGYVSLGGGWDKAFTDALFALHEGEVSGIVRSEFGFHIIKLEGIKGGETKPYEAVAAQLKREMQSELANEAFFDKAEQMASLTYEQPDTLAIAAEQLQLKVKSSDYFTRNGGAGIAAEPKVTAAAFSEDVLARGNNSETIELADNHLVVLRINDHRPETLRPFEEVKAEIEKGLKRDKAQAKALQLANSLFAKLQAGEEPSALAASQGLEWVTRQGLQRDDSELDRAIVKTVFRMPQPSQGGASHQQLTLRSGEQALVSLYAVKPGDVTAAQPTVRSDTAQRIERANVNAAQQALIAGLRERAEITIKQ